MTRSRVTPLLAGFAAAGVAALALLGGPAPADFPESPPPQPAGWTDIEAGDVHAWESDAFISGVTAYRDGFVLVGGGSIWNAPAAATWSDIEYDVLLLEDAALVDVATDGDRLVAVGLTGGPGDPPGFVIWTSDDGHEWRSSGEVSAFAGLNSAGVTGSSSGFVLQATAPTGEGRVFLSTDGIDWRQVDPAQFGDGDVSAVAGHRGGWLAVGSGPSRNGNTIPPDLPGRAWWSSDGRTWHRASISDRRAIWAVLPGSAGVLAVGASEGGGVEPRNLYHSADGRTWSHAVREPYPHQSQYLTDGQRIVRWAYQDDDSVTWSTDGVDWHVLDEPVNPRANWATMYLGQNSLLVAFDIVEDENSPSKNFVQLFRVR